MTRTRTWKKINNARLLLIYEKNIKYDLSILISTPIYFYTQDNKIKKSLNAQIK